MKYFAEELEKARDFESELHDLIKETIQKHKRIIFNGNGYDNSWVEEAEKRGLANLKTTPDALKHLMDTKNVLLFTGHRIFSKEELAARYDIMMENYCKIINIEALTMLDMARKDILPAMSDYCKELAETISSKKAVCADIDCSYEQETLTNLSSLVSAMYKQVNKLDEDLIKIKSSEDVTEIGDYYKNTILSDMTAIRISSDMMETIASAEKWPYPSYGELLFGVR